MMMFVRLLVWCLLYTDDDVCTIAGVVCYLLYTDEDVSDCLQVSRLWW